MNTVFKLAALAVVATLSVAAQAAPKQNKIAIKTYESSPTRHKAGGQNMAGCGLGSMVVDDPTKWSQVLAATVNGTGSQTIGITFGTSNCVEDGVSSAAREKDAFVEANYAELRRDLATGSGAYLSSLASLYGCKGEAAQGFNKVLRNHNEKIINANPATASSVIDSVVTAAGVSCQG
ncbi:MAG: DUF3015 family protein [Bacteriovoracia bacterium]